MDFTNSQLEVAVSQPSNTAVIAFLLIFVTTICQSDVSGKVVSVTDGDTIKVLDENHSEHKIRLTGIDAPESNQPYGKASKKHLASLVAGRHVAVESSKNDRYGRILGKVRIDGVDVNLEQLKAGYAWWYRYYAKTQPPEDQAAYELAEQSAKQGKRGLWSEPNPVNPYDWRKGKK